MTEADLLMTALHLMRGKIDNDEAFMNWLRQTPLDMVKNKKTRLLYQLVVYETETNQN